MPALSLPPLPARERPGGKAPDLPWCSRGGGALSLGLPHSRSPPRSHSPSLPETWPSSSSAGLPACFSARVPSRLHWPPAAHFPLGAVTAQPSPRTGSDPSEQRLFTPEVFQHPAPIRPPFLVSFIQPFHGIAASPVSDVLISPHGANVPGRRRPQDSAPPQPRAFASHAHVIEAS